MNYKSSCIGRGRKRSRDGTGREGSEEGRGGGEGKENGKGERGDDDDLCGHEINLMASSRGFKLLNNIPWRH